MKWCYFRKRLYCQNVSYKFQRLFLYSSRHIRTVNFFEIWTSSLDNRPALTWISTFIWGVWAVFALIKSHFILAMRVSKKTQGFGGHTLYVQINFKAFLLIHAVCCKHQSINKSALLLQPTCYGWFSLCRWWVVSLSPWCAPLWSGWNKSGSSGCGSGWRVSPSPDQPP